MIVAAMGLLAAVTMMPVRAAIIEAGGGRRK